MNRFTYLPFLIVILFIKLTLSATTLKWDIPVNQRLELVKTAGVKYYVNSRLKKVYEERNIIDLTCYGKEKKSSMVKGVFSVYSKERGENVFLLRNQYRADFKIEQTGRMNVNKKFIMPNLRHIPTFPAADIKPGETWNAPALLILNNFPVQLNLTLDVNYTFTTIKKKKGKNAAWIDYNYFFNKDLTGEKLPGNMPGKIMGKNRGIILWDIDNNRPLYIKDKYLIVFLYGGKRIGFNTVEFHMDIETSPKIYLPVSNKEKEKAKEELNKEFSENKNIEVDLDKRGIVLRLGEVLFDFSSSKLRNKSKNVLNKIINIVKKKYPRREIIVEGHTDIVGEKDYNKKLSQKRARSVAEYLEANGSHEKLSYRGFGSLKPIADNKTKKGREKNRRVELIIKLN